MMLDLLRTTMRVTRMGGSRVPQARSVAKTCYIPFFPMEWTFQLFPKSTRDKVRFMYRWNQIALASGFGIVLFVYHTPYEGASYLHLYHSPLYRWALWKLHKSNMYEENLRVKVHHFYPDGAGVAAADDDDDDE
eukprot:NODE_21896_length_731_cov_8.283113.p1 GENE.NODE_21896_length_731_cov_8.283113~~NODE_21896_length_731_cov_8.283113.p1  ORF type:complete len:156 (+),score=30.35 NODE_21896_length_731_cov_8.283113:68-469(+)